MADAAADQPLELNTSRHCSMCGDRTRVFMGPPFQGRRTAVCPAHDLTPSPARPVTPPGP